MCTIRDPVRFPMCAHVCKINVHETLQCEICVESGQRKRTTGHPQCGVFARLCRATPDTPIYIKQWIYLDILQWSYGGALGKCNHQSPWIQKWFWLALISSKTCEEDWLFANKIIHTKNVVIWPLRHYERLPIWFATYSAVQYNYILLLSWSWWYRWMGLDLGSVLYTNKQVACLCSHACDVVWLCCSASKQRLQPAQQIWIKQS